MSVSQYKDFLDCEAMAMAKIDGWVEPISSDLLIGSYVHAGVESPEALEQFRFQHPEIFSSRGASKGELKAEFRQADLMLEAIRNDPFCMFVLDGRKEVIITAEMFGVVWKIRIDSYAPKRGRFADLKTTRAIRGKHWSDRYGAYVSFVEAYDYITQMAVYCEVEKLATGRDEWLEPLMVAVSKEDPPDKAVIRFDEIRLRTELEIIQEQLPRIIAVKHGQVSPRRCEKCRYCRETKQLRSTVHYTELLYG